VPGVTRRWWRSPAGSAQCGQDRPVCPDWPETGDLTPQDGHFVAEDQDLGVLSRLVAAQPVQPAKDPLDGEVKSRISAIGDLAR
jgi:hypothetical protein